MKATNGSKLNWIGASIIVNKIPIDLNILPDFNDSKQASYNDESIPGRSFPFKSFNAGETRTISFTIYFLSTSDEELTKNITYKRLLESATYPRDNESTGLSMPPPICQINCGELFGDNTTDVILRRYATKYPRDVVWNQIKMVPYYFTMDTEWDVVYANSDLPGQERIYRRGN
jgi:hypothetical protein